MMMRLSTGILGLVWGLAGCGGGAAIADGGTMADGGDPSIAQVSAGVAHTCARRANGQLMCWGDNSHGALGTGNTVSSLTPVAVVGVRDADKVLAAGEANIVLHHTGTIATWGRYDSYELGFYTQSDVTVPHDNPSLTGVIDISGGETGICAFTSPTAFGCAGPHAGFSGLGAGSAMAGVTSIVVASTHGCLLQQSGSVACFGPSGVLGRGPDIATQDASVPLTIPGVSGAVGVAVGTNFSCALPGSGGVLCWGSDELGELGTSAAMTYRQIVPVDGVSDAVQITAAGSHACARRASGAVVCWGANEHGQLGDGTMTMARTPVAVTGLADAVEVSAGHSHTCARRASGAVVCWGANASGQLGDGTAIDRVAPTPVAGL